MNKERLLALADYMEKVDPANYDQGVWFENDNGQNEIFGLEISNVDITPVDTSEYRKRMGINIRQRLTPKEGFCGTSACVLGHAVFAPALKDAGLFLTIEQFMSDSAFEDCKETIGEKILDDFIEVAVVGNKHNGNIVTGIMAAMVAFDIEYDHANVIFGSYEEFTPDFYTPANEDPESYTPTPKDVAVALRNYVATDGESIDEIYREDEDCGDYY